MAGSVEAGSISSTPISTGSIIKGNIEIIKK